VWPPVVCLINVGRESTESTKSSDTPVIRAGLVSIEHEFYINNPLQNTTGMFIEKGRLWIVSQDITNITSPPYLQMVVDDLETVYALPNKSSLKVRTAISKLLNESLFNYDGYQLNYGPSSYEQCTYYTKETNQASVSYRHNYLNYGCQAFPSSSSVDQLVVACLYYSCNATLDLTIKTNASSAAQINTKDFLRFENELTMPRFEPQIETLDMPTATDEYGNDLDYSFMSKRRSFAVSRHPVDPFAYYVMTANMTLHMVKIYDEAYRIAQSTIIDGLDGMRSEYINAMVAVKNHIWCLMPVNRGLAKISRQTASIVKIYDLSPIIDDAAELLRKTKIKEGHKRKANSPPMTNYYMISAIAFDAKRKLFFITGQMWDKTYVIRIDDDDLLG
jgi:Glutamine cyclotransferase